jgi:hypothetical protein
MAKRNVNEREWEEVEAPIQIRDSTETKYRLGEKKGIEATG